MIHGIAANLRSCLECGAPLSPDAIRCPRCNADHPHGLLCCVCHEAMKASTAVALLNRSTNFGILRYSERGRDGKENYGGWYLNDCFRKALGLPLPQTVECGHCHNNVPYAITCEVSRAHISPCPRCGNPRMLLTLNEPLQAPGYVNCSRCKLPIVIGIHSAYVEYDHFHAACYLKPFAGGGYYAVERPGIWTREEPSRTRAGFWSRIF
jgi:hypothetical protein